MIAYEATGMCRAREIVLDLATERKGDDAAFFALIEASRRIGAATDEALRQCRAERLRYASDDPVMSELVETGMSDLPPVTSESRWDGRMEIAQHYCDARGKEKSI